MCDEAISMVSESLILENRYGGTMRTVLQSSVVERRHAANMRRAGNPQFRKASMTKPCAWFRNPQIWSHEPFEFMSHDPHAHTRAQDLTGFPARCGGTYGPSQSLYACLYSVPCVGLRAYSWEHIFDI